MKKIYCLHSIFSLLIIGCLTTQSFANGTDDAFVGNVRTSGETSHKDDLPLGIVKEQPADGRFVKTDQGFMVPYTTTIPGTEVEFEMVPIPGGTFLMGSPESEDDRRSDEGPQFHVVVEPFWMGKHEVTWAEYKKYMELDKHFKSFQQTKQTKTTFLAPWIIHKCIFLIFE